ncbi:MAG: hypothetical protein JWR08_2082 [Enterovirga sp.]|jgi:hypothetical protein|nr:hypothetical protein [Enterovirga sp.]
MSKRANIGAAVLAVLILAGAFIGYRYTQYGQAGAPRQGEAAMVDQKPVEAYKPRPQ